MQPERAAARRERLLAFIAFLPAMLAVALLSVAIWKLDEERRQQLHESERAAVEDRLRDMAGRISAEIRGDLNLSEGLISAISVEPDMTQARFAALASGIFRRNANLRSVAAAPGLVIRMVYPEQTNASAIGMDYRANPQQRGSALETINRRETIVTGPVDLVQGGTGLIVRYPVLRRDNGEIWGLLSSVIDLEKLYRQVGLAEAAAEFDLSLAKTEGESADETFFATRDLEGAEPVQVRIDLGYVDWTLSAVPKAGWPVSSPVLDRQRLQTFGVALAIVLPLLWAGLLLRQSQRKTQALQRREADMDKLSKRLEVALSASDIGVWELDARTGRVEWDDRAREMFSGPAGRDVFGPEDWKRALHPQDLPGTEARLMRALATGAKFSTDFRLVRPDGEIRHMRTMGACHNTPGGMKMVGVNWDVTKDVLLNQQLREAKAQAEKQNEELRAARARLEHQSMHDALTGLPNRRYLDSHIAGLDGQDTGQRLAVLHLDLDRFKEINDTLGHATGDHLLILVGERLLAALEPGEFVARVGGDEFVVVIQGEEPAGRARMLAASIVSCMALPFEVDGNPCRIGCSVGIAVQEKTDGKVRNLVVNADIALYEAKKQGRGRVAEFTGQLRLAAIRLKALADEFSAGIEQDQFLPVFQPQFDARSLKIVGVEALVRWNHPTRGLLPPGEFLPVAEDLNKVSRIDELMLDKGLRQLDEWRARGLVIPKLSVNISRDRLRDRNLFAHLERLDFAPGTLCFELLESISFEDIDCEMKAAIERLKQLRIGIEIDDFGTGHASIVNLLDLAPDRLKIDRKLVASIETSGARRRLVASIIEIGRSLGIEIVAEGVETMQQAKILADLGCNALQGYAFARPLSAADLYDFATAREPRRLPEEQAAS